MSENLPWKQLVLNENGEGPEGNVWTGCNLCGCKWRSDEGWIYREKIVVIPQEAQELMKLMALAGKSCEMAKWEYRCPSCIENNND